MNSESFETQLARAPLRELPAEWKGEILAGARPKKRREGFLPAFGWRNLLWPSPWAWAALAAVWIGIAGLNFSGPRGAALYAISTDVSAPKISPEKYAAYLQLRDQLLAYLPDPSSGPLRLPREKL